MCKSLLSYLQRWNEGDLAALPDDLMKFQLPITLFQALIRTVRTQNQDGSWGSSNSAEETAYALLILKSTASFSFTDIIAAEVKDAIRRGLQFILTRGERSSTDDQLWLDKTLYAIPTVSDVYIMAAVMAEETEDKMAEIPPKLVIDMSTTMIHRMAEYFARLPSQTEIPKWVIQASVIEAILLGHRLKSVDIFSTGNALGQKYMKYSACFWTLANNSSPDYLQSTAVIYSMAELSVGLFQEDELMENSLVDLPDSAAAILTRFMDGLYHDTAPCKNNTPQGSLPGTDVSDMDGETVARLEKIQHNIRLWFRFALEENLPTTTRASIRRDLQQEVKMATLAAIQQAKASRPLIEGGLRHLDQSFYTWLHTSAVHDVKSAVVSKSLICKIGNNGGDVFTTAQEKYLAEKLWQQIAIEGRLWNDLGSIDRDRAASNLNSVDFPEFSSPQSLRVDGDVRTQLTRLAEYEHKCTLLCLNDLTQILENSGRRSIAQYLKMYYRCCEIYAETCAKYAFASTTAK